MEEKKNVLNGYTVPDILVATLIIHKKAPITYWPVIFNRPFLVDTFKAVSIQYQYQRWRKDNSYHLIWALLTWPSGLANFPTRAKLSVQWSTWLSECYWHLSCFHQFNFTLTKRLLYLVPKLFISVILIIILL